ncbi:MAG: T9SS type A sorting domain-containing protein [Bacteroidetes bacterium]|nr:T9SS type A sorting domain-containing protein [Bacteroidota bacterium]
MAQTEKIVIPFIFFGLVCLQAFSQNCFTPANSVIPTTKGIYQNQLSAFNSSDSSYTFSCYAADTTHFKYYINKNGSLNALKCITSHSNFWPSNFGGVIMSNKDPFALTKSISPWDSKLKYTLLLHYVQNDTLFVQWKMKYKNLSFSDSAIYNYKMYIKGKTLEIAMESISPHVTGFTLDRSANTKKAKIIGIPYLTNMNVLYSQQHFISAFFDWEATQSSELNVSDIKFNDSSFYYGTSVTYRNITNKKYNPLREKLYISVSKELTDVFPNFINPISSYRDSSANRMVFDMWSDTFQSTLKHIVNIKNKGYKNAWVINHFWQRAGYDREYPDVMPASTKYGGDSELIALSDSCAKYNYLFSLHENYIDFYKNAPSFNPAHITQNFDGSFKTAWIHTTDTSLQMKQSIAASYINQITPTIHSAYKTNSSFVDVHTAINPARLVDFDSTQVGAGLFTTPLQLNRQNASLFRNYHNGPLSGEGYQHIYYVGYYDDIEAEINTARVSGYWRGVRAPLLLDFKLTKIHNQTSVHGVGYYSRFFSDSTGKQNNKVFSIDSTLTYMATELAYGNGSFILTPRTSKNFYKVAELENNHVFNVHKLIYNKCPATIEYFDGTQYLSASDYIRKHIQNFDSLRSPYFMSRAKISYQNGVEVFVNRNWTLPWNVTLPSSIGKVSFHASINNSDSLYCGFINQTQLALPPQSGWAVYIPYSIYSGEQESFQSSIMCYPNPASTSVQIEAVNTESKKVNITLYSISGKLVKQINNIAINNLQIDINDLQPGIYIVRIDDFKKRYYTRFVKID